MAYRQPAPYGQRNDYYDAPNSAPLEPPQEYREDYAQQQPYARPGTAAGHTQTKGYGPQGGRTERPPYRPGLNQNNNGYGQYGQDQQQDWNGYDQQQPPADAYSNYPDQQAYGGQANDPYNRPATAHAPASQRPMPHRSHSDNHQQPPTQRSNSGRNRNQDRALGSPTSPLNPSWDNSFPSYNNNNEQPYGQEGQRSETSASHRSRGSGRSGNEHSNSRDGRPSAELSYDRSRNFDRSRPGPGQQFNAAQRSNTMPMNAPNDVDLPIRGTSQPSNQYQHAQPANDPYAQDFPPPARAKTFGQEPDYRSDAGYRQPAQQASHAPQGSYGDVFDSYYDESDRQHHPHSRSAGEEDMPNFDAADQGANDGKSLHLNSHNQNDRGRPDGRGQPGDFHGAAHRSRSQPNLRQDQGPRGYDYPQDAPPMPNMNQQRPGYGPPPPNGRGPPPPHGRMGQRPPPGRFNGPNGPNGAQRPGPNGPGPRGAYGGPGSGPGGRPMGGQPPDKRNGGPYQSNRSGSSALAPGTRGGQRSPPNAQPQNPDALPEHPVPVRPGLMQQSPPPQQQMPPPVRQYTNQGPQGPSPPAGPVPGPPPPQQQQPPPMDGYRPVTKAELNSLRQRMEANPSDQATDLLLAQKLLEASHVLVDEGGRADKRTAAKNRDRYIGDAHRIVKKLVSRGYAAAMFFLADCHGTGQMGLIRDPKEAFNLYQSAAKLNHAPAAYRVAVCCEMGQDEGGGTRRDPLKALQWYKRAATLGDGPAMYKVGIILLKGLLGQTASPREAVGWLKRAAERADADNPHALHELGLLYESASGNDVIIRDEGYAFDLFMKAADLGYKFSQYRIGAAYEYGNLGCPIDPRMSITWYSKAAKQEEHQSELALSGWYLTGSEGIIQQSDTEAYLWARKAASAGLPKAEYAMGYFTETGIGCPADLEAAKRWYWKSASQDFPKAKERLEDLRKGGASIQKTRVSRSAMQKNDQDCVVM